MLTALLAFISNYIHLIGWSALTLTAFRAGKFFARVETRFVTIEANLNKALTNDLPHIEAALENVERMLSELREDVRYAVEQFLRH